jgi:hypothetical protein
MSVVESYHISGRLPSSELDSRTLADLLVATTVTELIVHDEVRSMAMVCMSIQNYYF